MPLPLTSALVAHLDFLEQVDSTNAELLRRAAERELPRFTVIATTHQTAGRGRLGRSWQAPAGVTVASSVWVPLSDAAREAVGWMPLAAGLAMRRAVASLVPERASALVELKWPNDVLVGGRKLSGILCELAPNASAVVIGAGLNLTMSREQLPVPTATSLVLEGASPDDLLDRALAAYLGQLSQVLDSLAHAGFDAEASLRAQARAECSTLGRRVRVDLPAGEELQGTAVDLDASGRLVVTAEDGSGTVAVAAGDVTHVRHA